MTLPFMQKFPPKLKEIGGQPTNFVEKIWQSFPDSWYGDLGYEEILEKHYDFHIDAAQFLAKRHTIREDKKNQWRQGIDIHFVINNRRPDRLQFAPVLPVQLVQKIEIEYFRKTNNWKHDATVAVDDVYLDPDQVHALALNDGFDNTQDFFEYFGKNFTGKIIHWTGLKY
jgi:hypothetical protein